MSLLTHIYGIGTRWHPRSRLRALCEGISLRLTLLCRWIEKDVDQSVKAPVSSEAVALL